ncbi:MAG: periplasmic heavy metal sensor [Desulfobacteraceae bacterium]|nr:MAG: periplasmic heavy metal sensor [Desulfobacteraceae bacterium]
MKKLLIPMVAILSFSVASAFAQPWGKGMREGYGRFPHNNQSLNLTQEQTDQLQRMRESYVRGVTHLQNRLFSKQGEIRLLWKETDPDREKIMAKEKEISRIQEELSEKEIQFQLDCRSILTEEQKAKLTSGNNGMGRGYGRGWQRR